MRPIARPALSLRRSSGVLASLFLCAAVAAAGVTSPTAAPAPQRLRFVPNAGQWDGPAAYGASLGAVQTFFEPGAIVVRVPEIRENQGAGVQLAGVQRARPAALPGAEVAFVFEGAAAGTRLVARDELTGTHSYYLGADASRWRTGLPAFGALDYAEPWPGIALTVAERDGALHYDVLVEPGADESAFALRVKGALCARVEADGSLVAETLRGAIRQTIPAAWEEDGNGTRHPVTARFVARESGGAAPVFGLLVAGRDASRRLVIDPGFDFFALYVAAPFDREDFGIAIEPGTGTQIITGYEGADAVVTSLDVVTGVTYWVTLIGGTDVDNAIDLAFDAAGDFYVSGATLSLDMPTTPGSFMPVAPGLGDAWVAHMTPVGAVLELTYIGGTLGTDALNTSIDIGADGLITVSGYTESPDFPIGPAGFVFDPTYNGLGDVWVMRLDPALLFFVASTFVGGVMPDTPGMGGVAVADDGSVSLAGWTESPGFPVLFAVGPIYGGAIDAFLTRLDPGLAGLLFSTFRGGPLLDGFNAVDVDDTLAVWAAGYTESPAFPFMGPPGVLDFTYNGPLGDAFVVKHAAVGDFIWGTFRGGGGLDQAIGLEVDRFGRAHITGQTNSGYPGLGPGPAFPITPIDGVGPFDLGPTGLGSIDGFVNVIGPDGDVQSFSGYVGLGGDEIFYRIALDDMGNAFITGTQFGVPPTLVSPVVRCTLPWVDLGLALPGLTEPQLMGDGVLTAGTPLELRLGNLLPFTPATLIIGFAPFYAPFRGGTMIPLPAVIVPGLVAGAGGEIALASLWPAGIPSDTLMWMQAWMPYPATPVGFGASNGVMLVTP